MPLALPALARFEAWREWIFRTVSQVMINYRGGPISGGQAGAIHGGDRLPWVEAANNYAPLGAMVWQVHVYGDARPELAAWCRTNKVPLHVFAWSVELEAAGFAKDALYLLRPDTYVALANRSGAVGVVQSYLVARGFELNSSN